MSEVVGNPFTAYNSTGHVQTLVGNWREEQVLKEVTGTSRCKAVVQQHAAEEATVFAVRQDVAVDEPTHSRVIEHTEQLLPSEWVTHNTVNFQPPAACTYALASYPTAKHVGPREKQELKQLYQEAVAELPAEPAVVSLAETTYKEAFQAHNMEGMQFGARVMKTQDGAPVTRDPTFLAESKTIPRDAAARLMPGGTSTGNHNSGSWGSGSLKHWIGDPSVPITLYTEAAAKGIYSGEFYGTTSMNKLAPMNRSDGFTKLIGDPNKRTEDQ